MLTLTIRTDRPEAEIGLFDDSRKLAYVTWQAHRQLAETIHEKIRDLLKSQEKVLDDIQVIAVFKGPGSFTGLRIGASTANALADSLGVSIVGTSGEDWIEQAAARLKRGGGERMVLPEYGAPARTTKPKH
jgi:tRNA threonylcarbamoyladenosine biosynthesis protein TsaB